MNFAPTVDLAPPLAVPHMQLKGLVRSADSFRSSSERLADPDPDRDRRFVDMLAAYRQTGGLARGDEVVEMLQYAGSFDVSRLARAIVTREVLSFDWRGELWVPLFQFDLKAMSLREAPQRVAAELAGAFDGWTLAVWFATPNSWLAGRMPVEVIGDYPGDVFQAARADRFVAMG
jgi:hypothetical protein